MEPYLPHSSKLSTLLLTVCNIHVYLSILFWHICHFDNPVYHTQQAVSTCKWHCMRVEHTDTLLLLTLKKCIWKKTFPPLPILFYFMRIKCFYSIQLNILYSNAHIRFGTKTFSNIAASLQLSIISIVYTCNYSSFP